MGANISNEKIIEKLTNNDMSISDIFNVPLNSKGIPKIIWSYWHDKNVKSSTVIESIKSWAKHNPDYKIILLNKENIKYFLKDVKNSNNGEELDIGNLKHARNDDTRMSDYVRVNVLCEYGGIWSDSSILNTMSYDKWFETLEYSDLYGFYIPNFTEIEHFPVLENWFFCSKKNSRFIKDWRDEFMKTDLYDNVSEYVNNCIQNENVNIQKIDIPVYLAMHVSAQKIIQSHYNSGDEYTLKLLNATAEHGPFFYLNSNDWNSNTALVMLSINFEKYAGYPFIKFRGIERRILDTMKILQKVIYNNA